MQIIRALPTQATYLESAVYSPQQHKHYGQDDLFQLAGVLAQKITLNHAYQDGNKRTALLAADMFLRINGYKLREGELMTRDELDHRLKNAHVATATNEWDADQLGSFYKNIVAPSSHVTSERRG